LVRTFSGVKGPLFFAGKAKRQVWNGKSTNKRGLKNAEVERSFLKGAEGNAILLI